MGVIIMFLFWVDWSLLGISRTHTVAVVLTTSVPVGFVGFDIDNTLVPSSISVICLMPGCSSLKTTISVILNQKSIFPDSADMMYL